MSGYCVAYSYNAADQLTVWPGMHSYEYDDNGALAAVKTADGSATQQSFTYHPNGLMDTATFNGQTITNLWDADERRVRFTVGEDQYTAVFDVTAGIPAVIKDITPQGTVYYVREPGGELICRVVGESRWYYHFDELGSTRLLTDGSGAVTDRYSYDAYGAVISHDRNTGTIDQPYQYVGQLGYYTHSDAPEFGWLQLGVRFYQPEMGRFERRDPVAQASRSTHEYARGNPVAATDPDGKFPIRWGCLDDAMKEANRIHYEGEEDDKVAHCYFACRAARCFGVLRFCPLFPLVEEILGRYIERRFSDNDPEDMKAQTLGIAAAYAPGDCRSSCAKVMQYIRRKTGRYHKK